MRSQPSQGVSFPAPIGAGAGSLSLTSQEVDIKPEGRFPRASPQGDRHKAACLVLDKRDAPAFAAAAKFLLAEKVRSWNSARPFRERTHLRVGTALKTFCRFCGPSINPLKEMAIVPLMLSGWQWESAVRMVK